MPGYSGVAAAIRTSLEESGPVHDIPQAYKSGELLTPLDHLSIPVLFPIPNPIAASALGPGIAASALGPGSAVVLPEAATLRMHPLTPEMPPKHSLQVQTPAIQLQIKRSEAHTRDPSSGPGCPSSLSPPGETFFKPVGAPGCKDGVRPEPLTQIGLA